MTTFVRANKNNKEMKILRSQILAEYKEFTTLNDIPYHNKVKSDDIFEALRKKYGTDAFDNQDLVGFVLRKDTVEHIGNSTIVEGQNNDNLSQD